MIIGLQDLFARLVMEICRIGRGYIKMMCTRCMHRIALMPYESTLVSLLKNDKTGKSQRRLEDAEQQSL